MGLRLWYDVNSGIKQVPFVKETEIGINKSRRKPHFGILYNKAKDFILDVDLERRLRYPDHNAVTERRPDMVIYSNLLRKRTFKITIGRKWANMGKGMIWQPVTEYSFQRHLFVNYSSLIFVV